MTVELKDPSQQIIQSPYSRFLYALNSPEPKKRYSKRFEVFLNFIYIEEGKLINRVFLAGILREQIKSINFNELISSKDDATNGKI